MGVSTGIHVVDVACLPLMRGSTTSVSTTPPCLCGIFQSTCIYMHVNKRDESRHYGPCTCTCMHMECRNLSSSYYNTNTHIMKGNMGHMVHILPQPIFVSVAVIRWNFPSDKKFPHHHCTSDDWYVREGVLRLCKGIWSTCN